MRFMLGFIALLVASASALNPMPPWMNPGGSSASSGIRTDTTASAASRVGAFVMASAKDTMHWAGNSYCEAGGAFTTENLIFNPKYGFIGKNQCNGSGIGVTNVTFIGTIYANTTYKGYQSTLEPAGNDMWNGLNRNDYRRVLTAGVAWYAFPDEWKSRYDSATYSGVWTADSDAVSGFRPYKRTNTSGAYVEFPCTGASCIFATMLTYPSGGTFSVKIDGIVRDTLNSQLSGVAWNGATLAPAAYVIKNMSAGLHTIRLTSLGTNRIYFGWWNNGIRGYAPTWLGLFDPTPVPKGGGYFASVDTFKVIHDSIAADLALVGAPNVRTVPASLDPAPAAGMFRDSTHPSVIGMTIRADSLWYHYSHGTVQQGLDLAGLGNFIHAGDSAYLHGLTVTGTSTFMTTQNTISGNLYIEGTGAAAAGPNISVYNTAAGATSPAYMELKVQGDAGGNPYNSWTIAGISTWSAGLNNQKAGNPWALCSIVGLVNGGCVLEAVSTSLNPQVKVVGLDTARFPYGDFTTSLKTPSFRATLSNVDSSAVRNLNATGTVQTDILRANTAYITSLTVNDTNSYKPKLTCDTCILNVKATYTYATANTMSVFNSSKGLVSLPSAGALSVLRYNAANTDVEAAVPSGSGAPLNGTSPSITTPTITTPSLVTSANLSAGFNFTAAGGTTTFAGSTFLFSNITRFGALISLGTPASANDNLIIGGTSLAVAATSRSLKLDQTFGSTVTTAMTMLEVGGTSTGSFTTSNVRSIYINAFTKGAGLTISGDYAALDIASLTATASGSTYAIRTGAVGDVLLGIGAGTGNRPACFTAAGKLYPGTNIATVLACP